MSSKDLEKKAVEIEINKNLIKVVSVEGSVKSVSGFNKPIEIKISTGSIGEAPNSHITGYQKKLNIILDPNTSTEDIELLKFQGTSSVKGGDRIKAGLILDDYFKRRGIGTILYVGILKQDGSFGRIDYIDGYNPMQHEVIKLGLD